MAGCGGGIGKRLRHPSPKNLRDSPEDTRDGLKNIRDSPKNLRDGPENIRGSSRDIHDSPEEERIEAQPPYQPLPAL